MQGDKTVYQKYIKTSARVGYAPPDWKRAEVQGVPTKNKKQLQCNTASTSEQLQRSKLYIITGLSSIID